MEAMEAIMTRRSIRRYTGKQVSPELERKLLEASMAAPSAHNGQPWHFIVVRSRETLDRVPEFHRYSKMLREASLAVVVCGDNEVQTTDFWAQDCSAATENMLLAATAMGLGAAWVGSPNTVLWDMLEEALLDALGRPPRKFLELIVRLWVQEDLIRLQA